MPSFDVGTLRYFSPPFGRCAGCRSLFSAEAVMRTTQVRCGRCQLLYEPPVPFYSRVTDGLFGYDAPVGVPRSLMQHLEHMGLDVDLGPEPLVHAANLAYLAAALQGQDDEPLAALLKVLRAARSFVHITTFGIDDYALGVLQTIAQDVQVDVVASGIDKRVADSIGSATEVARNLTIVSGGERHDGQDQMHGKLIVIDGLVAITGSPNFTLKAWQKAAREMEIVHLLTDLEEVMECNNRYFSSSWIRVRPHSQRLVRFGSGWAHIAEELSDEHDQTDEPAST